MQQIVPYHMEHHAEPEAVDLLLEVRRGVICDGGGAQGLCTFSIITVYGAPSGAEGCGPATGGAAGEEVWEASQAMCPSSISK